MKKLIAFLFLLAFVVGCQKDEVNNPVPEVNNDKFSIIESMGLVPLKSAVPIVYTDMCPGDELTTDVPKNSIGDPSQWDYYRFYGIAGVTVYINVVRVDCVMDPSFSLFFGTSETTEGLYYSYSANPEMEFITFRDDQLTRPEVCAGFCYSYGDPGPAVTLPYTGWYTVAVHDYISCESVDPLSYTISISGLVQCDIIIDGCDPNVRNTMTEDGLMQDLLDELAAMEYKNHGQYVLAVAHLVNGWYDGGLITLEEKDAIMACAAESSFGVKM